MEGIGNGMQPSAYYLCSTVRFCFRWNILLGSVKESY